MALSLYDNVLIRSRKPDEREAWSSHVKGRQRLQRWGHSQGTPGAPEAGGGRKGLPHRDSGGSAALRHLRLRLGGCQDIEKVPFSRLIHQLNNLLRVPQDIPQEDGVPVI